MISSPSFCFPLLHSTATSCDHDAHPPSDVTFPCSARAASTGSSRARAHKGSHAARSSALGLSLLPMSGFQPSPSRATPGFRHGGHGVVKPRSWPPSGTHPPPGGVMPFRTDRHTSLSGYSHARPLLFAVAHAVAKATQVRTRNRASPIAIEEPPLSRDLTTRPLRRSPRHPRLFLRRR